MKKSLIFILVLALCLGTLCSCGVSIADIDGDYKIEKNIYYAMLADKAYNPDDGYSIEEKDGKTILFITHIGVYGETVKEEAGELKSFLLGKSSLDNLITGEAWQDGASASSLRKNNKAAWKTEKSGGEEFYVLLQDNGDVLVAQVKTKEGVKSCSYIRKIEK
jgi:hypothetical protein